MEVQVWGTKGQCLIEASYRPQPSDESSSSGYPMSKQQGTRLDYYCVSAYMQGPF